MDPLGESILTGGSESFDEPLTTQQVVNIAIYLLCAFNPIEYNNTFCDSNFLFKHHIKIIT
jgi:hypothetical protein